MLAQRFGRHTLLLCALASVSLPLAGCGSDEASGGTSDGSGGEAGVTGSAGAAGTSGQAGSGGGTRAFCIPDESGAVPTRPTTGTWEKVELPGTVCGNGSQYKFWVNFSGTSNNLLVMFEPGGACWDYESCSGSGGIRGAANPNGLDDGHMTTWQFAYPLYHRDDPDNPTADWNYVFVPYCTGDVHTGNNTIMYENPNGPEQLEFHHAGHSNMKALIGWMNDTFNDVPRLLAGGCSAGGAGSIVNYHFVRSGIEGTQCGYLMGDAGPIFTSKGPSGPVHEKIRESWNVDPVLDSLVGQFGQEKVDELKDDFGSINTLLADEYTNDRLTSVFYRLDLNYSIYSYDRFHNSPPTSQIHDFWWEDTQALMAQFDTRDNLGYFIPYFRLDNCSHCASILPLDSAFEVVLGDADPYGGTEIQEVGLNLRDYVLHLLDDETPLESYLEGDQDDPGFTPEQAESCR